MTRYLLNDTKLQNEILEEGNDDDDDDEEHVYSA